VFKRAQQDGVISAFFVITSALIFLCIGVVIDGGRQLSLQMDARYKAQEAAQFGADQLSRESLYESNPRVDNVAAIEAVDSFLTSRHLSGKVWVDNNNTVYVTVSESKPTLLLSIIGLNSITVTVTEAATDLMGVAKGKEI
jgi:hypothetical protein